MTTFKRNGRRGRVLTDEQVAEMRALRRRGDVKALAARFGVSYPTALSALNGKGAYAPHGGG